MALLIAILTFLVATAAFLFIWLFAGTSKGQEVVRQRMEAVRKAERRGGEVSLGVGVGSSRVDLQACKLEYSIVSPK